MEKGLKQFDKFIKTEDLIGIGDLLSDDDQESD